MNETSLRIFPRVVAVITAYNSASYVERAIRSIRAQQYPNLDRLLIDDGSLDSTYENAREAAAATGGVTVLRNERNIGFSGSLNRALALCGSDDLLFVHQDDVTIDDPTYVARAVRWMDDPAVALITGQPVGFSRRRLSLTKRIFGRLLFLDCVDADVSELSYSLLKADLVRAEAVRRVGGFTFVVNRKLGLEDKLLGSALRTAGYRLVKDPRLQYVLDFARTETLRGFLAKEFEAGQQLGYAVAMGLIIMNPIDRESAVRRRHRLVQVLTSGCLMIAAALAIFHPVPGASVIALILLLRTAAFVRRADGLSFPERLALAAVGHVHDPTFTLGFGAGVAMGLVGRLRLSRKGPRVGVCRG